MATLEDLMPAQSSKLKSKKLVAYLTTNVMWKALVGYGIYSKTEMWLLLSMVVVSGIVDVGYILGQASLDKVLAHVRGTVSDVVELKGGGKSED